MMQEVSFCLLTFDPNFGGRITKFINRPDLTEKDEQSLISSSFPDCSFQGQSNLLPFVFKIQNYFCFALFSSISNPKCFRGFDQFTIVIFSKKPFIHPFSRLLQSSLIFNGISPSEIFEFVANFVSKWIIPITPGDFADLPLFDGTLRVALPSNHDQMLSFFGGIEWAPNVKTCYLNDFFLGFDLSLFDFDYQLCWEKVLLGDPIIVYGLTPHNASSGVLALASLIFPECYSGTLIPFISVFDHRFVDFRQHQDTMRNYIFGVANPIATQIISSDIPVLQVGFDNKKSKKKSTSVRKQLYNQTLSVIAGIRACLDDVRLSNPYSEFLGQIGSAHLQRRLGEQKLNVSSNFSKKLIHSPFFISIWNRRCTSEVLEQILFGYNIQPLCEKLDENSLIDLISIISSVKKRYGKTSVLNALIKRDHEIVRSFLSKALLIKPL